MQVSEVLRRKAGGVVTVAPELPVRELVARLREHAVGALVVSSDGASLLGIVSERDVVRRLASDGAALLDLPVSQIMTSDVRTCQPEQAVDSLMVLMTEQRIRHIPVVSGGRLTGIVSIGDVVKQQIDELQSERDQLSAYITS